MASSCSLKSSAAADSYPNKAIDSVYPIESNLESNSENRRLTKTTRSSSAITSVDGRIENGDGYLHKLQHDLHLMEESQCKQKHAKKSPGKQIKNIGYPEYGKNDQYYESSYLEPIQFSEQESMVEHEKQRLTDNSSNSVENVGKLRCSNITAISSWIQESKHSHEMNKDCNDSSGNISFGLNSDTNSVNGKLVESESTQSTISANQLGNCNDIICSDNQILSEKEMNSAQIQTENALSNDISNDNHDNEQFFETMNNNLRTKNSSNEQTLVCGTNIETKLNHSNNEKYNDEVLDTTISCGDIGSKNSLLQEQSDFQQLSDDTNLSLPPSILRCLEQTSDVEALLSQTGLFNNIMAQNSQIPPNRRFKRRDISHNGHSGIPAIKKQSVLESSNNKHHKTHHYDDCNLADSISLYNKYPSQCNADGTRHLSNRPTKIVSPNGNTSLMYSRGASATTNGHLFSEETDVNLLGDLETDVTKSRDGRRLLERLDAVRVGAPKETYKRERSKVVDILVSCAAKYQKVSGIYFDKHQLRWSVGWTFQGRRVAKYFPVKLYGLNEGYHLAVAFKKGRQKHEQKSFGDQVDSAYEIDKLLGEEMRDDLGSVSMETELIDKNSLYSGLKTTNSQNGKSLSNDFESAIKGERLRDESASTKAIPNSEIRKLQSNSCNKLSDAKASRRYTKSKMCKDKSAFAEITRLFCEPDSHYLQPNGNQQLENILENAKNTQKWPEMTRMKQNAACCPSPNKNVSFSNLLGSLTNEIESQINQQEIQSLLRKEVSFALNHAIIQESQYEYSRILHYIVQCILNSQVGDEGASTENLLQAGNSEKLNKLIEDALNLPLPKGNLDGNDSNEAAVNYNSSMLAQSFSSGLLNGMLDNNKQEIPQNKTFNAVKMEEDQEAFISHDGMDLATSGNQRNDDSFIADLSSAIKRNLIENNLAKENKEMFSTMDYDWTKMNIPQPIPMHEMSLGCASLSANTTKNADKKKTPQHITTENIYDHFIEQAGIDFGDSNSCVNASTMPSLSGGSTYYPELPDSPTRTPNTLTNTACTSRTTTDPELVKSINGKHIDTSLNSESLATKLHSLNNNNNNNNMENEKNLRDDRRKSHSDSNAGTLNVDDEAVNGGSKLLVLERDAVTVLLGDLHRKSITLLLNDKDIATILQDALGEQVDYIHEKIKVYHNVVESANDRATLEPFLDLFAECIKTMQLPSQLPLNEQFVLLLRVINI